MDYLTVTTQDQIENLVGRLKGLELEHFRQSTLEEEALALGDQDGAAEHLAAQEQVNQRIAFVRGKLEALGATFGPTEDAPLVVEQDDVPGSPTHGSEPTSPSP